LNCDLVIIGGGLVGLALAAALKESGLKIVLLESQAANSKPVSSATEWDNRIYAIGPANARFLQELNVWQTLPSSHVVPIHEMRITGDDGSSHLKFSAYEAGVSELAFITENRLLHAALLKQLQSESVTLLSPAKCTNLTYDDHYVSVHLQDGTQLKTKLLVGADGAESWVRKTKDIKVTQRSYHQVGLVANFRTELPHHNRAWQWFHRESIMAYLPLSPNQISIVWSIGEEEGKYLLNQPAEALADRAAEAGHHTLGKLETISKAAAFPLQFLSVADPIAQRIVLIGDAAHCIHPLAGQGVNLGLQDAKLLAEIIATKHADCGAQILLRQFRRVRKEDVLKMQWTTDALQKLFNNNHPLLGWLRNTGLNLTNHLPIIKNSLIQQALS
jgi:ubiquinone biosynthesis UbiH/UbiF/VisC/COQ6 family hydroxylase